MNDSTHPEWVEDEQGHIWTRWYLKSARKGPTPPMQYRTCIHPNCKAVQEREHPAG